MVAEAEAFPAFFYDEGRNAFGTDIRSRNSKYNVNISFRSIGDENLTAVEQVVVPFIDSRRFRTAGIGTCVFFSQTEGAQFSPFAKGTKYFFFCSSFPKAAIGYVPSEV